jgi:hypothetical protein
MPEAAPVALLWMLWEGQDVRATGGPLGDSRRTIRMDKGMRSVDFFEGPSHGQITFLLCSKLDGSKGNTFQVNYFAWSFAFVQNNITQE